MFYSIAGLCPTLNLGGFGFCIKLYPEFREAVAVAGIDQTAANNAMERLGRLWLDCCGFDGIFDPDNCGFERDEKRPPGPNAQPSYRPNREFRIKWGEWGPEHITVPGNACGLDISRSGFGSPRDGAILNPHNVDSWRQVQLLLVSFCWFADSVALAWECNKIETRKATR
jgi:hypothetical protein